MDFMKGRTRRVKPLARSVTMDGRAAAAPDQDQETGQETGQDTRQAYDRGYIAAMQELTEDSGVMTHDQVLELLDSAEFASKHGKTIAKALRTQWGME